MIIIVDDRETVTDSYRTSFAREGIAAVGFTVGDFEGWVGTAAEEDVGAVSAFLIGEGNGQSKLTGIIKRRSAVAVIAMRDQKTLDSTLELFADGVDDVIFKPCHVREILARIEAISRRTRIERLKRQEASPIQIFRDGRAPLVCAAQMDLPRRELRILEYLVVNQSRRVTKSQIFNAVYGLFEQRIDETVIESHISKLRKRLRERLGYDPVDSKRHLGYVLVSRAGAGSDTTESGLDVAKA